METVNGYVDHIIYQNSENGYTVMSLVEEGKEITCVGMCRMLCRCYTGKSQQCTGGHEDVSDGYYLSSNLTSSIIRCFRRNYGQL